MVSSNVANRKKILFITQFSMLVAIEAIIAFTPLGSLQVGPLVATLGCLPVIIAAILMGTGAGTAMGFVFGLFSFILWTFMPPSAMAFVFTPFYSVGSYSGNIWSLVICFVPRILVGLVTGLSFKFFTRAFRKFDKTKILTYGLSGIMGSLTNTILVLTGMYVFFGHQYIAAGEYNILLVLIGSTILTNGIPEAIIGALTGYAVCMPVRKYLKLDRI